jgi:hypothetical protein
MSIRSDCMVLQVLALLVVAGHYCRSCVKAPMGKITFESVITKSLEH